MSYKSLVLVAGLILAGTLPVRAQELVLGQTFGSGVHAYYAQDYVRAYDYFNTAIEAGSQDPRCFYYRGLCYLRLDRDEAAKADFQKGAALESGDAGRNYPVARLLERVQGQERLILEQYRATARMAALQRDETLRRQRYEQNRAAQSQVLQAAEPVATPAGVPAAAAPAAPAAAGAADGFQTGPIASPPKPEEPAAMPAEQPAAEAPKTDEDPFGGAAEKPAAKKAKKVEGEDPFGGAADEKPAKPAAKKDKPAADADPFGMAAPAEEKPAAKKDKAAAEADPFGAPAEKPAAKKDKAADADPFGAPAEKPAAKKDKPAAAADDDPFGAPAKKDKPASKPAADK